MYDPVVGQFLEEDPSGFAPGDSHLFRYVENAPTNATDPSGHHIFVIGDDARDEVMKLLEGGREVGGLGMTGYGSKPVAEKQSDGSYMIRPGINFVEALKHEFNRRRAWAPEAALADGSPHMLVKEMFKTIGSYDRDLVVQLVNPDVFDPKREK